MDTYWPLVSGILIAAITGFVAYLTTRKQAETTEAIDLREEGRAMRQELRDEIKRLTLIIEAQNFKIEALERMVDTLRQQVNVLEKAQ